MNTQFAIQNGDIYLLEVNPRASRCLSSPRRPGWRSRRCGARHGGLHHRGSGRARRASSAVFRREGSRSLAKFRARPILRAGNEIHGRGDGHGCDLRRSLRQGELASGVVLPMGGAPPSVRDPDKPAAVSWRACSSSGFEIIATHGTAQALLAAGAAAGSTRRVSDRTSST